MAAPTSRLLRRVRRDFGAADADLVISALGDVPECLPLGESQDPERLQACLVLGARGRPGAFVEMLELAHVDWRDVSTASSAAEPSHRAVR